MYKALFLDKDGTLIRNIPYNTDPDKVELTDGVGPALRSVMQLGFKLIVISNQSGIARGFFAESALEPVRRKIAFLLAGYGVRIDGFYYCPHYLLGTVAVYSHPCACRKPAAGLFFRAAREQGIDLSRSFTVGDILDDMEAGHQANTTTILYDAGHETEWHLTPARIPDFTVSDFLNIPEITRIGQSGRLSLRRDVIRQAETVRLSKL